MGKYIYELKMKVRDYECDLQGIVNNANYQHYLEATRHKWLQQEGYSFQKWHDEGLDMMVSEIYIKYKTPLRGMETFVSCFNVRQEGARFIFDQDIYRKSDMKLCVSAQVTSVCLIGGRLSRGEEIKEMFAKYL